MTDKLHRKRIATILRAYADKIEHGHIFFDYVLRNENDYAERDRDELECSKQEVVDNVETNLRDLGPDCDVDEVFSWHDLGVYVPIYSPRFSNVRPACLICYKPFEFLADVTADYVDATRESTDVEPHLCSGHMAEIEEQIGDSSIPAHILDAYRRIKKEQK